MILDRLFLQHCREQDESYAEHARFALGVGAGMVLGGLACMVHGVAPALFTSTGSRTLARLSTRLADRRGSRAGAERPALTRGRSATVRT